ncbi:MAG TPA: septal ring lytic transglycosylase RlpA family protein [Rubrivivax sp.]|nr:septal ring lytic transglycosylase RlpA family protein [Rubrivivax sp.]
MSPRAADRSRRWAQALVAAALALLLAACGSVPRPGGPAAGDAQRDGPPANPPPDLITRPDPEPRVEPIRSGGPNKPYEVLGQRYTPLAADAAMAESGLASWYGRKFHGRPTASGEPYDMYASSAAHRTMPIPSYALVRNPANGREVVVRINDRGPFYRERVIDLSYTAALKLDVLRGVAPVEVRRLTHDDIRSGRWRGETALARAEVPQEAAPAAPAPAPLPMPLPASPPAPAPASESAPVPTISDEPAATPAATAAAGYWVQLGAFRQRQGAHELRELLARELGWLEPWLAIFDERSLFRVQAGPFATRSEAQGTAERIRAAAPVQPMLLQRR